MPARKGAVIDATPKFTRSTADDDDKLLTMEQAADILNIARGTLKNWSNRGQIEFVRMGRDKRFTRAALRRFIARHTAVPRD